MILNRGNKCQFVKYVVPKTQTRNFKKSASPDIFEDLRKPPVKAEIARLKPLPYPINGLEPVISAKMMDIHFRKHHEAYVNNLNLLQEHALEAYDNHL